MTVEAQATATRSSRPRRPGTAHRRRSVVGELLGLTAAYLVAFFLLVDFMRHLEVNTIAGIFDAAGSNRVTVAPNDTLFIAPHNQAPFLAVLTPSCSSLMGILALGALAIAVLRHRRGHTVLAYIVASLVLFWANIGRMVASCYAGVLFGRGALILFHDWVGTVWNFVATLFGFLLLLYLTLPPLARAEQDLKGRHTAHRPENWARAGLGYRVPRLARAGPTHRTFTGWTVRHLVPPSERARMEHHREEGRVDYRVGFLDADQRRKAIAELSADGIEAHGATLLALATYEEDPLVLDALSAAIVEHMPGTVDKPADALLAFWSRGWLGGRDPEHIPPPIPETTWRLLLGRRSRWRTKRDRELLAAMGRPTDEEVDALVADGLGYRQLPLLALVAGESDPTVLRALAEGIARRQWEPTTSPAVTALRLFARGWLWVRVTSIRSARSTDVPGRSDGDGAGAVADDGASGGDGAGTQVVRVAVTGVGGPAGFSVCRALQAAGHDVFGLDPDPMAAGFRLEGIHSLNGPRADDEHFGERILALAAEEHFGALISTVAEELPALIAHASELTTLGCANWFPMLSAVEICLDKARFAVTMRDYGIPHPPTATTVHGSRHVPEPFVVKPRFGRGSRGVDYIDDRRHMRRALRHDHDLIVQSRLAGEEWTADVLVDRNGQLVACVPRWRLEVRGGISTKGATFDSQDVTRVCAEALAAVGLTGVANVQGVIDPGGLAVVIEINPRFSGGLPLSLAAGSDLVGAYLHAILHPDRMITPLYFRPGTTMVRHFEEMFEVELSGPGGADGGPAAPSTAQP